MSFMSQLMQGLPQGAFSSSGNPSGVQGMQEKIPSGYRKFNVQQFTPEQMDLYSQMFSHLDPNSYLSKLAMGDQSQFGEIEAPALRQFNELMGGISSKFSGMGLGGRKGSGFQHAATSAAQDFASQLQSQRQGLTRQALQDLMSYSQALMQQRPFESGLAEKRPKQNSFLESLGSFGGMIPGFLTGGGQGAAQGANMTMNALGGF
jgi:hypothetical protein